MQGQVWYDYVRTNVNLFFISGLVGIEPPWFEQKPKFYKTLWRVFHGLTDLILYIITAANLIGAALLTDVFDVLASMPPLIHGLQLSGRLIILQWKKESMKEYIQELNELLTEDLNNPFDGDRTFREIHDSDFVMNKRLTRLEFLSLLLSNAFFFLPECLKSFVNPDEAHVIIVSWYPYDANVSINKQLTNAAHTISWLLINFKMASFDTIFQSFIILHASQFKQLRYFFTRMFAEEDDRVTSLQREENLKLSQKLRWWIAQHQRTLSATKKLELLYSPLLFFSYIECLFNMCLCAFLTTVESPWTPVQRFSAVFVVGTVFVQMFVMCRLGDYLEETSTLVAESGFTTKIFRSTHQLQYSMLMVIRRVYLPVKFSALKLFYLNSKYYGALVQGVFSYYMALRQFQSRS